MRRKSVTAFGLIIMVAAVCSCAACKNAKNVKTGSAVEVTDPVGPAFDADSAYAFCQNQCDFGARAMNTPAHEQCKEWIAEKFRAYGCLVEEQQADLKGYDGTILKSTNIIAKSKPSDKPRILICAHWDSRPWADNDPDSANWHKPVMAANDGASGIAVMLEIARLLQQNDSANMAVDFICFDAEDWGTPQWTDESDGDSWALGAQYWASHFSPLTSHPYDYGILLDMVGGQSAKFYREYFSMKYARNIVEKVWQAASAAGYGSYFPAEDTGGVTDDHLPLNEKAGIPCIDIINHYPDCEQSSFGPTWHTINDDLQHIDKNTLQAVGQTLIQLIFS